MMSDMQEAGLLGEDEDISPLISRVAEYAGIDFSLYRETTLRRRINRRIAARGCADLASYLNLLDSDRTEYEKLLADLTIKYSEFFRDPDVIKIIADEVLAELVTGIRACQGRLSIWSAGCATGEEAFSIAALVRRALSSGHKNLAVKIIATDIDPAALEIARAGVYRKELLPSPIPEWATRYFSDDGRTLTAAHIVKELVEFHTHDLLSISAVEKMRGIYPGLFDMVMCRNVLIYLKRPAQLQVLATCTEMLKPGGFLILGNKEVVPKGFDILEPYQLDVRIYRKRV